MFRLMLCDDGADKGGTGVHASPDLNVCYYLRMQR